MSMIKCSECGKEVSDKAYVCPSCGNPISAARANAAPKPKSKKKTVIVIVIIIAVISIASAIYTPIYLSNERASGNANRTYYVHEIL